MADSMRVSPAPDTSTPDASISHADALKYWTSIPADVNGMLGGYPQISRIDLQGSSNFLAKLIRRRRPQATQSQSQSQSQSQNTTSTTPRTRSSTAANSTAANTTTPPLLPRAVDCGAGIGRITHGLLLHHAHTVDIVEPVPHFTSTIETSAHFSPYRSPTSPSHARIGDIHNVGLESWTPTHSYDLIWNQWCLGQLTDKQVVAYFQRCKICLQEGGWVVVKENLSTGTDGRDIFDEVDSSVTRAEGKWETLFEEAGLRVVASEVQKGLPRGLYPVRVWALQPVEGWGGKGKGD